MNLAMTTPLYALPYFTRKQWFLGFSYSQNALLSGKMRAKASSFSDAAICYVLFPTFIFDDDIKVIFF
jgi:hypothetical protein